MLRRLLQFCLGVVWLAAVGCGRAESPSGLFTGTWSGIVAENRQGTGQAHLVIEQRGATVTGSLRTTFGGVTDRDGPITGLASGGGATLTYLPASPFNCGAAGTLTGAVTMTVTLTNGRLHGTYTQFTCGGLITATLDLGRQ